jgi:signal peptidase I
MMSHRRILLILLEFVLVISLIVGFGLTMISGESMEPTLQSGDLLVYARFTDLEIGDIVIFHSEAFNKQLIKRVDQIEDGKCYVLGDNPAVSEDSRNPDIGWIAVDDISGKALVRVFPFGQFKTFIGGQNEEN